MKCCGHFPLQLGKVGNKMTDKSLKENNYNEEHTIGRKPIRWTACYSSAYTFYNVIGHSRCK